MLLDEMLEKLGIRRPGCHKQNIDALRREFRAERLAKASERKLAGAILALVRAARGGLAPNQC